MQANFFCQSENLREAFKIRINAREKQTHDYIWNGYWGFAKM